MRRYCGPAAVVDMTAVGTTSASRRKSSTLVRYAGTSRLVGQRLAAHAYDYSKARYDASAMMSVDTCMLDC